MKIEALPVKIHAGHCYGDSWLSYDVRYDRSYVFVNIPKNASTWMKRVFTNGGTCFRYHYPSATITDSTQHDLREKAAQAPCTFVIILREPMDRWISGLAQRHAFVDTKNPRHWTQRGLNNIALDPVLDDHTEPQVSYLNGIDTDHAVWFDWHHDLSRTVWHWMQQNLPAVPRCDPPRNSIASQDQIKKHIQHSLIRDHFAPVLLREFYQQDRMLYESVPYYHIPL